MSTSSKLFLALRPLVGAWLCAASAASAQIYGSVGADGSVVLSNFRTPQARELVVDDGATRSTAQAVMSDTRFSNLIDKAALDTRLSRELLRAVISVESGFNTRAVSPKGAKGLMQLMPATATALGVTDPFDAGQNIAAGAAHLRFLLDRFDNNLELALAAYNAGADAVVKAGYRIPGFAETRAYVPRVLARARVIASEASSGTNFAGRPAVTADK